VEGKPHPVADEPEEKCSRRDTGKAGGIFKRRRPGKTSPPTRNRPRLFDEKREQGEEKKNDPQTKGRAMA